MNRMPWQYTCSTKANKRTDIQLVEAYRRGLVRDMNHSSARIKSHSLVAFSNGLYGVGEFKYYRSGTKTYICVY